MKRLTELYKNIESIELTVLSEKRSINLSSFDKDISEISEESPPECKYLNNFTLDVSAVDSTGKKVLDIGFVKGTSIEAEITFTDVDSFLTLCDMVSTDLYHMAEAICDEDGHVKESICSNNGNIMYIENIYVDEKCRGLGIGEYLLNNIDDLFLRSLNYSHRAFILKPFPQVKCGKHCLTDLEYASAEQKKRLIDFYKRAGYEFVEDSDYMCKTKADEIFQMLGI